jgi:Protein tyrosine and serine/threonine kinase
MGGDGECARCCEMMRWSFEVTGIHIVLAPAATTVVLIGAMVVLLVQLSRVYGEGLRADLSGLARRRKVSALTSGIQFGGTSDRTPLLGKNTDGTDQPRFVLPTYVAFALVAGLLFLFEGVLHFVAHPRDLAPGVNSPLTVFVRYFATSGCFSLDAFVVTFILGSNPGARGWRGWGPGVCGSLLVFAGSLTFFYALPQDAAETCTYCGIHVPTPYAPVLEGTLLGVYALLLIGATVGRRLAQSRPDQDANEARMLRMCRLLGRRSAVITWLRFLILLYSLAIAGIVLAGYLQLDMGFCFTQVSVLFLALVYPFAVWRVSLHDSLECLELGLLDDMLSSGGGSAEAGQSEKRLVDPASQGVALTEGGGTAIVGDYQHDNATISAIADGLFRESNIRVISPEDIHYERRMGAGGAGEVWQAKWSPLDTSVAVKRLHALHSHSSTEAADSVAESSVKAFVHECRLMARLSHPNILQFIGVVLSPDQICLISPYVSGGSLFDALHGQQASLVGKTFSIVQGVGRGMAYLHGLRPPVLHRDLKSPNILLDEATRPVICDFGLARAMKSSIDSAPLTATGTVQWTAPEVLLREDFSTAADVFSYGVVLWELLTHECPWPGITMLAVAQRVARGERLAVPDGAPSRWSELISQCVEDDPSSRPSFPEILSFLTQPGVDEHFQRDVASS